MLPGGDDPTYRAVLAGSHEPVIRVSVWDGLGGFLAEVEHLGGSVGASLTSRVTRNLNLTVAADLYPWEDSDLLAPYGNELRVHRGVRYGDGQEVLFPVFRGKIQEASMATGGTVEIDAADRAQEVVDAEFERPTNSSQGVVVDQQFRELVLGAVPDAEFGPIDSYRERMPALTWETDRAGAADEVATAVGSFWYVLAGGEFVLRRIPWTVAAAPTLVLTDDETRGGLVLDALPSRTRDGVYNSATAVGERTDGSDPVYGTAEDNSPASPTYVGGKFGRKHKLLRLQTPASQQTAAAAARSWVMRTRARAQRWSWNQVPDAAMELGEVVGLDVLGRSGVVQVVTSFTMPLDTEAAMTVVGRSQMVGVLDG